MTILPKKKQQTSGGHQQQQQDGRHQSHAAAASNVRSIDESSALSSTGPGSNSSTDIGTVGASSTSVSNVAVSSSSSIPPFLSTSTGPAVSSVPSPHHHGGDVSTGGGGIGQGSSSNANASAIRRSHDITEADAAATFGPHRRRHGGGVVLGTAAGAMAVGSSGRPSQSERSSPYRTTRRPSRSGATPVATSNSAPAAPVSANVYGHAPNGPISVNTAGSGAYNSRSNLPSPEVRDEEAGYNSEDEHEQYYADKNLEAVSDEIERKFEDKLQAAKGYRIKKMKEDGACLFRAVADQVYGDEEMHGVVRKLCMDYVAKNSDYFKQFITEDFVAYVERKRKDTTHGNHVEMQAMAELFNRPIQVYQYSCDPINTFHSPHETDNPAIRVSYHRNVHYNSVVDPYAATIGVGLGLPQFYPGLAEKNLMRDAERASEQDAIEDAMLEDKIRATDWEATDEQLQEQVARESYLQWLRDQEKQMKENAAARDEVSTTTTNLNSGETDPVDYGRPSCSKASPNTSRSVTGTGDSASSAAASNYYVSSWADEEDEDLLSQVLALSEQEYFESLKSQQHHDDPEGKNASCSRSPS